MEFTSGEGLDVVATVTNGVVTSLTWNKRDYSRNPDAYQYNTAPALVFEPVDQNGGGARAHVIVSGGEIIDIVLDHGGSGYTSAPIVNVTRRYKIKKKREPLIPNILLVSKAKLLVDLSICNSSPHTN